MLIDMIDYHEPTLVIVGSRGLAKIKGMLLGSVSNYLIQKSSVPVMVSRTSSLDANGSLSLR
jgi:nucleotide-binding universal stress UspA family protein